MDGRSGSADHLAGKCEDLVKLTIHEFHCDLHAGEGMFPGKINRTLGVLEVEGFISVRSPVSQATEVELCARVLQQNFHRTLMGLVEARHQHDAFDPTRD